MRLHARILLGALAMLTVAADDPVPVRPIAFAEKGRFLTVTTALPELGEAALRKKIREGFAQVIVLRVYLYREGEPKPLGLTLRTYRVWYDLWDEKFVVQMQDPQGQRSLPFKTEAEAMAQLTKLDAFPLVQLSQLPVGVRHFAAVIVEVNPVTPELLAQARRWIAHPGGSERSAGGETFFGSFISVFVNSKISEAERVIKFRSQPFARAGVKPAEPKPTEVKK
jgi:hypothetical protein